MAENVAKLRTEGGRSEWQGMGRARRRPSMLPTDHVVDANWRATGEQSTTEYISDSERPQSS